MDYNDLTLYELSEHIRGLNQALSPIKEEERRITSALRNAETAYAKADKARIIATLKSEDFRNALHAAVTDARKILLDPTVDGGRSHFGPRTRIMGFPLSVCLHGEFEKHWANFVFEIRCAYPQHLNYKEDSPPIIEALREAFAAVVPAEDIGESWGGISTLIKMEMTEENRARLGGKPKESLTWKAPEGWAW